MSKLRFNKLTIRDFRCFSESTVDLSADIIAIYGRNGVGKTGIFDAIEFALFGSISRLGEPIGETNYISRIGCTGDSHVQIDLDSGSGHLYVKTLWDRQNLIIDGSRSWPSHRDLLYDLLVDVNRLGPRKEVKAVRELFHSSLMLSQYSIRDFVQAKEPEDRAKILANLAGVAHIQRSKDKAEQVVELADYKRSNSQKELRDVRDQVEELKKQLSGLEGRRMELDERLGGDRPKIDNLLQALIEAKIIDSTSFSESETDFTFSRAAQERCSERIQELMRRNERLSVLEAGIRRYIEQTTKLELIRTEVENYRSELSVIGTEYRNILMAKQDASSELSKLESQAAELSNRVREFQQLRDFIQQSANLNKELSDIESAFRTADEEYQMATQKLDDLTRDHETALQSRNLIGLNLATTEKEFFTLEAFQKEFTRYVSVCAELESTASKVTIAEADYQNHNVQAEKIAVDIANLKIKVSEAETAASKAQVVADQQHNLLIRLRSLVTQNNCPLCGAEYESIDALLRATDRTLEAIPETNHLAIEQFQNLKNQLSKLEHDAESNLRAKNKSQTSLIELRNSVGRLTAEKSRIEEITDTLDTVFEENEIRSRINAAHKQLQELKIAEQEAIAHLERENATLKLQESQTKNAKEHLAQLKSHRDKIFEGIESVALAITQLGYGKTEIPAYPEVQKNIENFKSELVEIEKSRSIVEATKINAENMERDNTRRQEEINGRLTVLEKEIGTLQGAIQTFVTQCEGFGIKPAQKKFEEAKQDLENNLKVVFEAKRIAEQLELIGSLDTLQSEKVAVEKEYEIALQQYRVLEHQVKNLKDAKRKAESWILPLAENLETMVERTLRLHQLEIERHFKAMIPSPHLFDQIVMRHGEERLEIGVRYRHQPEDAGEPYFYLSNAQLNILALAIFLSLGAKQRWSNLDSLLLDDPVQHLDDLDAVAFLDTIRAVALGRFGSRRQIILSTCDNNLYRLMIRKFKSLESAGLSFNAISLIERGTKGPVLRYDVHRNTVNSSLAS